MTGPIPSPNIWNDPQTYEVENLAVDREHRIEAAILAHRRIAGARLLDLGCGSGFHLARWVGLGAARVVGVEPHPPLLALARARVSRLAAPDRERIRVLPGGAESVPLPDASIDVMHARWAYFFGSGSEPGLRELDRVMAAGGVAFVVDNDLTVPSTFGSWFAAAYPAYDADATERFWSRHGWGRETVVTSWEFDDRADLEAVVRIEFPPAAADRILAHHEGRSVDYAVVLRTRAY
ncbi:methyltransferase domain-containing protein [Nostocoides sp. F2B08]|uniref:class I SAM-dependent methyltransferase n=1 Tax=Nostocoides sp. F2B08 TaxID=2653936 RepID=UPI001262DE19|nr:class I SAM-dependent methyltransferase [Tetrasphaera sp. F2B08]KAB7746470.1 methyltransferase domain-containing protein [Tetrasphaera sp. F2B08]